MTMEPAPASAGRPQGSRTGYAGDVGAGSAGVVDWRREELAARTQQKQLIFDLTDGGRNIAI